MPRIVITAPGRNPQPYRFQLDRQSVKLGRGSENDIVIDDGSVSVSHAAMERIEGGYELRDLGSTNGIKLNGVKDQVIPLRNGLSVKIGDVSFDFSLTDEERAALHREKPEEQSPIIKEPELEPSGNDDGPSDGGPRRARPAGRVPTEVVYQGGPGPVLNFVMTVLFLALAGAAFWIGLSFKYKNGKAPITGKGSLWSDVKDARAKRDAENDAPADAGTPAGQPAADGAPAAPDAPAPAPEAEPKKPE